MFRKLFLLTVLLPNALLAEHAQIGPLVEIEADGRILFTRIVDIDQDGRNDLLIGDGEDFVFDGPLYIHYNISESENPVFQRDQIFEIINGVNNASIHDLDRDGDLDIMTTTANANGIWWLENIGGNPLDFTPHDISENLSDIFELHVADFDGDENLDFLFHTRLITDQTTTGIHVVTNDNGDMTQFTEHEVEIYPNGSFASLAVGDFNNDGKPDIVGHEDIFNQSTQYIVYLNESDENGLSFSEIPLSFSPVLTEILSIDIENDHWSDFIGFGANTLTLFHNQKTNPVSFQQMTIATSNGRMHDGEVADMDYDGDEDVVYTARPSSGSSLDEVFFLENEKGIFSEHKMGSISGRSVDIALGELNQTESSYDLLYGANGAQFAGYALTNIFRPVQVSADFWRIE